jgi:hypothetical protein
VSAPKLADVVCAQIFFRRKGTKPILQVTVLYSQKRVKLAMWLRLNSGSVQGGSRFR